MNPVLKLFKELVDDTVQYKNEKESEWASLGHFMRAEVSRLLMRKNDLIT